MVWWGWLVVSLAGLLAASGALAGWLIAAGRRHDLRELVAFVPDCAVLLGRLLRDPRVRRRRKLLLLGLVAYLALPFDLVPDFVPVVGQLDDVLLVVLVLRSLVRSGGELAIREQWPGSERSLALLLRLAGTAPGPGRGGRVSRRRWS